MPASLPSERLLIAITTLCPACRSKMTLANVTRDLTDYAVHTLECAECPRVLKKVVKFCDPMKSPETTGWLNGQLVAPT